MKKSLRPYGEFAKARSVVTALFSDHRDLQIRPRRKTSKREFRRRKSGNGRTSLQFESRLAAPRSVLTNSAGKCLRTAFWMLGGRFFSER